MIEAAAPGPAASPRSSWIVLGVFTVINLLNYLDRYVVAAVLEPIGTEFGLTDTARGALGSAFIWVYTLSSPIAGYLGDRVARRRVVALGVMLWSLATVASGLAPSYGSLLVARAITGVGEAAYTAVVPSILADLFGRDRRGRILSVFYVAIPVGAALGYIVGGAVGAHHGWRAAFYVAGAPGLVLGLLALALPEPRRGALEGGAGPPLPPLAAIRAAVATREVLFVNVGMTLMVFAIGGLANWMPSFLQRERGFDQQSAGVAFGVATLVGGIVGTAAGGWLGDRAEARRRGGYLWVSGVGLAVAAPVVVAVARVPGAAAAIGLVVAAEILIFFNTGPLNAALVNAVAPGLRSTVIAANMFVTHLFGDGLSPYLIGAVSDRFTLGTAVASNAVPVFLGGAVLCVGAVWLSRSKGRSAELDRTTSGGVS